jgi:predicted permease
MDIFFSLLLKLIPLYALILIGFIAGKKLNTHSKSIASLLIYVITPLVVLDGVAKTKIDLNILSLPILFFILCSIMCLVFYKVAAYFWKDPTKNILAFTAGTGNTGYFGFPVAIILFGQDSLGIAVMAALGFTLYESSVGFFITAKGHHTLKECLIKVLRLPTLYAFFIGVVLSLTEVRFPSEISDVLDRFVGAYTVLGMMMIGLGLSGIQRASFDRCFIGLSFTIRFVIWPLAIALIIFIDSLTFQFYGPPLESVMILMSVVPLAANTVTLATEFKAQPDKAALTVLLSTGFALFYIPFIVFLFLQT